MPSFGDIAANPSLGGKILLGGDVLLGGEDNNKMLIGGLAALVIVVLVVYLMCVRNKEKEEGMATGIQQSGGPSLGNWGFREWDNDNVRTAEACGSVGGRINQRGCDNDFRQLAIAEANAGQHGTPEGFNYAGAIRGIPSENFSDFPANQLLLTPLEEPFANFEKTFDTTTFGNAPSMWPGVYEGMDNSGSMHSRNCTPFASYKRYREIEALRRLNYPDASRVGGAAVRGQLVQKVAPKALNPCAENMADLPVFNVGMAGFSAEAFSPTGKYGYMKAPKRSNDISERAGWGSGQPTNPFVGDSGSGAFVPFSVRNYLAGDVSETRKKKLGEKYTNVGLGTNSYYRRKGAYADGVGSIVANSPYSSNRAQFLSDWTGATTISAADVVNTTFGSAELLNSVGNLSKSELAEFSRLADTYTYEQLHSPIIIKALRGLRELSRKGEICLGNPRGKEDVKAQIRQMLTQLEKYDMYVEDAVLEELVSMAKSGLKEKNGKMCLKVNFTQAQKDRLRKLEAFVKKNGVAADLALYKALLTKASQITTKLIQLEAGFTPFNACRVKPGRARWDSESGRRIRHGLFTPSNSCDYNDYHKGGKGARSAPMPKQCRGHLNQMVLAINKSDAIESENAYRAAYNKMCACVQRVTGTDYCSGTERPGSVYSSYSGKVPTYDDIKNQYGQ